MSEPRQHKGSVWVCHACPYWMRGMETVERMACPDGHYMDKGVLILGKPEADDG